MKPITCAEAKKMDMVEYIATLGFTPAKIRGNDYWFLSPFRSENTASFKINRKFNVWYDHGMRKGGNLVDFGILYFKCTVDDFLSRISDQNTLSFHPPFPAAGPLALAADEKEKIIVLNTRPAIRLQTLQNYLQTRNIPLAVANRFCVEVDFRLNDKKSTVIGFENSSGGYELRSAHFKGSSSPKDVSLFGKNLTGGILVFEGFMDFLSFVTLNQKQVTLLSKPSPDFLILNSLGFVEKMKERLDNYSSVCLYLDRDKPGITTTNQLLSIGSNYKDESHLYKNYKDLNDYLVNEQRQLQQRQGRSLGL